MCGRGFVALLMPLGRQKLQNSGQTCLNISRTHLQTADIVESFAAFFANQSFFNIVVLHVASKPIFGAKRFEALLTFELFPSFL
jgi:hypothetical protein